MAATDTATIDSIRAKIAALERSSWSAAAVGREKGSAAVAAADDVDIAPELRRARRAVQESHCYSSTWKLCPSNYYTLGLEERKAILGAHSTSQLCKACLFENKNFAPDEGGDVNDPTNSRYYLVVVQYVESIDTKRLASELRGLRPAGPKRFGPNYFADLRLAPEEVSEKLTGYGHNGVSPFGMLDESVPVIVCESITKVRPAFVWMGGGHKDWKLGMAVSEFVRGVGATVLDVSEPRTAA